MAVCLRPDVALSAFVPPEVIPSADQAFLAARSPWQALGLEPAVDHLSEEMRAIAAEAELLCVATADAAGRADCVLRGGPSGFVRVLGPSRVAYPVTVADDRSTSVTNILGNPNIDLLLTGLDQTALHLSGRAHLSISRRRLPGRWVVVDLTAACVQRHQPVPAMRLVD